MSVGVITPNIIWYLKRISKLKAFAKKSALLYDHIILNPHYAGVNLAYEYGGRGYLTMNLADNDADARAIERLCEKDQCFTRPNNYGIAETTLSMTDGNSKRALEVFPQLKDSRIFAEQFPELGLVQYEHVLSDIGIMISMREVLSECVGLFDERHCASILQDTNITNGKNNISNLEKFDITIPDFGELTWEEIEILRKDKYIKKFREFAGDENKVAKASKEIWGFIGKTEPNLKNSVMIGVFSNIPFPIANPISVGSSVFQVIKEKKIIDEYGWLFFLERAKRISSKNLEV